MQFKNNSLQFIDIYSFSHISHGIIFYYIFHYIQIDILSGLYLTIILEFLWEMFENTDYIINKYRKNYKNYHGDSNINIFGDIINTIIGYLFAYNLPYTSIIYLILSELLLIPYKASLFQLSVGGLI
jgi:hypothetical protein